MDSKSANLEGASNLQPSLQKKIYKVCSYKFLLHFISKNIIWMSSKKLTNKFSNEGPPYNNGLNVKLLFLQAVTQF